LLFVPHVDDLKIVSTYFDARIPELQYGITHAKAADRQQVVQAMRDENIQGLITTTILERGVTLPGIDVIILGADDEVFSKSALIQMAGRCGRSARRPDGKVFALVNQKTNALLSAKDEIHRLNRMGNL
jgi:competence protein ComFA